jgi:chloramphenicol-sensitive protein RarD
MALPSAELRSAFIAGLGANVFWGLLPILFHFLDGASALTAVANRMVWSLLVVGIILGVGGRFAGVLAVLKDWRTVRGLLLSALLLAGNWLLYVWAVQNGHVLEGSFGYFINPLVNVATGMLFFGERQNRWQALAIFIAIVAIGIQAVGIGGVPYISLGLALSFGFYGYVRKTVHVPSTTGLFVETLVLLPLAVLYIAYSLLTEGAAPYLDPRTLTLLVLTGPATAAPLLLFAYAVRRLRLTSVGMLQYIAPSFQFVLAVGFFHEQLTPVRLLSFVLIWISLAVFSADSWHQHSARALA